MMSENLTWLAILTLAAYRLHPVKIEKPTYPPLSWQHVLDMDRWKHNGEQPISFKSGNRTPDVDLAVKELREMI